MRKLIVLLTLVMAMVITAASPGLAGHVVVNVDPGELVEVIDGIFITVEPNGDVSVIDGIYVQKFSTGGQPTSIQLSTPISDVVLVVVPGGCELKCT